MNFTYYFYCACDYEVAIHQYGEEVVLQCSQCLQIDAKKIEPQYHLECIACGTKQNLEGEVSFDPRAQEMCPSCGLWGEIGFEKGENVLLVLGSDMKAREDCTKCTANKWVEYIDHNFTCPFCFHELKQKMSLYWEEKKDES